MCDLKGACVNSNRLRVLCLLQRAIQTRLPALSLGILTEKRFHGFKRLRS